jgi:energy-coupling factor transporter ATP-binding protein EcfA2
MPMRVSRVFLRRYKSFNVSFGNYPDRRAGSVSRPWNRIGVGKMGEEFGFVEIPIEEDVTTIVGANESGKSHLLSSLSKVLTGKGGPGDLTPRYGRTDLCHFAPVSSANSDVWPEIGIELASLSGPEWKWFAEAAGLPQDETIPSSIVLLLVSDGPETAAMLFIDNEEPVQLKSDALSAVRDVFPGIRFIDAQLTINDHVSLGTLIAAYSDRTSDEEGWFTAKAAEDAARTVLELSITPGQPIDSAAGQRLATVQTELRASRSAQKRATLEALLFRDVLGVDVKTLEFLSGLTETDRTYADSVVANWNKRIDERLNLARYWQQDDQFILRANLKKGTIFFEITDKTGAVYTFRERSSGLRYFLSYYIQAKAIEMGGEEHGIVLMDEPDSFLSVVGQRNLLSVFESLVSPDSSRRKTQLIYTTHSPFLINRNFPRRLRLVRKGDGEEGTVLVDAARVRRYEPVRSALGIDCAQTMFMGATNLILEGPVDQFLLCELVRIFSDRSNLHTLLDLNDVVVVSAESASRIAKLLDSSLWEDEPNPSVVVLVDSDGGGNDAKGQITGQTRNSKKRIDAEFVKQIADLLGARIGAQAIVTSEDLIPSSIYRDAIKKYVDRYAPEWVGQTSLLDSDAFGGAGVVVSTEEFFRRMESRQEGSYDKLGVAESAIALIAARFEAELRDPALPKNPDLLELRRRLLRVCAGLRDVISESRSRQRRESTRQALVRHVTLFMSQHHEGSTLFDLEMLVRRLNSELEALGKDGLSLTERIQLWREEIVSARQAGSDRIPVGAWPGTLDGLRALRHDPFSDKLPMTLIAEAAAPDGASAIAAEPSAVVRAPASEDETAPVVPASAT